MTTCGCARVSTDGQTLDAEVAALKVAGAERAFSEKQSGAKTDRAAGPRMDLNGGHLTPSLRALIAAGLSASPGQAQSVFAPLRLPPCCWSRGWTGSPYQRSSDLLSVLAFAGRPVGRHEHTERADRFCCPQDRRRRQGCMCSKLNRGVLYCTESCGQPGEDVQF